MCQATVNATIPTGFFGAFGINALNATAVSQAAH
jgi:hypothetical protein